MNFESRVIPFTEDGRSNITVLRFFEELGGELAFIDWELNGELYYIKVPEQYRRKGIATRLWNAANDYTKANNLPKLTHSEYRSNDGEAWARSFNVELPKRIVA
jgi:GNAT superfamily N-acetyltransferase